MIIPNHGHINAFAMIVDINSFTLMVENSGGQNIAQFTRDVLVGGVEQVENSGGSVVGFMGDAFYAILPDADKVFECCIGIANDLDKQCEYISSFQNSFSFVKGGPKLKIGIEYGSLDISEISSKFLGQQKLFIGTAVNYAFRITSAGRGNRCLIGPNAYNKGLNRYSGIEGPYKVRGKMHEQDYVYYNVNLDDVWRNHPTESSWR